jgi:hypothetical protein
MNKPTSETSKTHIVSFVIRFVQDQTKANREPVPFRGAIRHIQTDQEVQFTHWEDAEDFIRQFVSIDLTPEKVERNNP